MTSYLGVIRTVMLADTSQFNMAMASATRATRASAMAMRASAQSLVGIGAALNLGITIPTLLAVRAISKVGIEFDSNMMKIKNVTDMTTATFEDFKKAQRDLSFSMGVSQIELSKVGYLAGQAQLKTVAQLTSFQKAVAMSQIVYPSDAKPEEVASGFISVINAFSIKEKDYEKTMAEMIQTINLGTISWQEYSNTIQQVVALSSSFKSPTALKNLNIAAAIGTQGGVRGNQVMTALRNVYTRIYKESGREGSGLNYVAGTKGYRNAAEMFKAHDYNLVSYLKAATGEGLLATPEFLQAIKLGSREITTGGKLANSDPEVEKRFRRQYDRAQADMLEKYEEAINNPINIFKRLGSAYTNLKLEFWSTLGPSIIKVTLGLTELLKTLARLPESAKKLLILIPVLASVASMFTLLIGIFKSAVLSLRMLPSAIGTGNSLVNKTGVAGTVAANAAASAVAAKMAARTAKDSIQEQILRTRLARETALTNGILARNIANAAKGTKGSGKTAKDAIQEQILKARLARETALTEARLARETALTNGILARNAANAARAAANAAKAAAKGMKTANASTVLAGMAVSDIIKIAKDAVNKARPAYRTGTAFQNQYPIVLRDPFTSGLHPTKPVGGWMRPLTVYRNGKWIDPSGGFKEKARAASQFLPVLAPNFRNRFGSASRLYRPNFTHGPAGANIVRRGTGAAGVANNYVGMYPAALRASGGLMGIPTPNPSRHRNPTFAPYVGGGSMFSGVVPKFFESIKTQFIALTASLGKWTVVGAKFLGIGLLIFAFFNGLADALSVTLFPVLRSMGIKIEDITDIFGYLVKAVELLSKTFAVLLVTVIHVVETLIGGVFALVQGIWGSLKNIGKLGSSKEDIKSFANAFMQFAPERSLQEKFEDLLKKWGAPDGKLKNMFDQKAIDQKVTAETTATNNLLARAPNTKFADFAEYGTQAGFNAIQEGRAGAAEEIRKLREQAAQQQIEKIKADAANTNVLAGKLDVLATQ